MKNIIGIILSVLLLAGWSIAHALNAEEECRQRNASRCEMNGLQFGFTGQECPPGVKVLKKLGHENCEQLTPVASAPVAQTAPKESIQEAAKVNETSADKREGEFFIWSNPYFILALIGLLQGMISRISAGSMIIVMAVMPIIATWSILSDAHFTEGLLGSAGYIAMEWLGTFLFSVAGWLTGAGVRRLAYKILLGV